MNLSDKQKQTIAQRLSDGASIADIQRLLADEFDVAITFMETRFLLDDLNLDLKQEEPKPDKSEENEASADILGEATLADEPAGGNGSVTVEIDKIKQPGVALSGTVSFSDGVSAKWYIDQTGRLGLDPEKEGYQPSPADIETFQLELQNKMQDPKA